MAERRMTIAMDVDPDGELRIYVNPEGREWLVKELQRLSAENDHFHLFSPEWGGDDLNNVPYDDKDRIVHGAKVLLRLDEWDQQYFPHVMKRP